MTHSVRVIMAYEICICIAAKLREQKFYGEHILKAYDSQLQWHRQVICLAGFCVCWEVCFARPEVTGAYVALGCRKGATGPYTASLFLGLSHTSFIALSQGHPWPLSQEANKARGICSECRGTGQLHLKDSTVH